MKLFYEVDVEDLIRFNLYHYTKTKHGKKTILIQRLFGPILIVGIGALVAQITDYSDAIIFWAVVLTSAIWFFLYPMYFRSMIRRQVNQTIQKDENKKKSLLGKHQLEFGEKYIIEHTPNEKTRTRWNQIIRLREDKGSFYLFVTKMNAIIIPKRLLDDPAKVKQYILGKIKQEL